MSDEPPAKRRKFTDDIITITAGRNVEDSSETFRAHETKLKECSPFFKAALGRRWKKGQHKKIDLPEDLPDIVSAFLEFVYDKTLPLKCVKPVPDWLVEDVSAEYNHLARIYVFGEKIQNDSLCNAVITRMAELCDQDFADVEGERCHIIPSATAAGIIYDGTPEESPARKFLVWLACVETYRVHKDCHQPLVLDVANEYLKGDSSIRKPGTAARDCHKFFKPVAQD